MADRTESADARVRMQKLCSEGAELRPCGFRPEEHFVRVGSLRKDEEERLYLEVKWREYWFHRYCDENGILSRSIEELPAALIQGTDFLQAQAVVKMNGEVAGRGVGGFWLRTQERAYAVQMAGTIAKGRALANAGFGTVFSSARASETGGAEIPCDSGLKVSEFFPGGSPAESGRDAGRDRPAEKEPVQPAKAMTAEQAVKFRIPVRGRHYGEPLGEVMAKDPAAVRYFAENPRYAGTLLQTAAVLVAGG